MPIRKTVKARWPDADEIKPTLELNAKTSIKLEFLFGESAELSHIKRTCQLHFFCDIYFKAALKSISFSKALHEKQAPNKSWIGSRQGLFTHTVLWSIFKRNSL
ncbi:MULTISPECIES: hypothetical protein [Acinetobacter]|jgi:hypothetical protein|nr:MULTISPECIES: hypothetical protein [Acinetobacter]MBA5696135.1 hypothetical protein [Acinetobacter radioresistens]MBA5699881.1 hypothetical protein [Acinetobacter radioresistens]MCK4084133.1 hypothetical protein [Acinetobacter radioresistens]MCK4095077.1 hypothetical protein [Acinetobacter radioresistens]MCK4100400.1 hypothetical protein [Acinetobacter radioresistens]